MLVNVLDKILLKVRVLNQYEYLLFWVAKSANKDECASCYIDNHNIIYSMIVFDISLTVFKYISLV